MGTSQHAMAEAPTIVIEQRAASIRVSFDYGQGRELVQSIPHAAPDAHPETRRRRNGEARARVEHLIRNYRRMHPKLRVVREGQQ